MKLNIILEKSVNHVNQCKSCKTCKSMGVLIICKLMKLNIILEKSRDSVTVIGFKNYPGKESIYKK